MILLLSGLMNVILAISIFKMIDDRHELEQAFASCDYEAFRKYINREKNAQDRG